MISKVAFLKFIAAGFLVFSTSLSYAEDKKETFPIASGLESNDLKNKLDGDVKFFFAGQPQPEVIKKLGTQSTIRKTNGFAKASDSACNRAFASVLIAFEEHAKKIGANAVINIVSYNKKEEFSSATEYECHSGFLMSSVTLKGDFVKISNK